MAIGWLIALIVLLAVEIATMGLTTIWFAGGAFVAFVMSIFNAPLWAEIAALLSANIVVQVILFVAVSLILLIFTRPVAVKYLNNNAVKTNAEGLIGRTAKVIYTIDNVNSTGYASVDGQEWTARSEDNSVVIPEGTLVTIVRIEGVKLIVKKKEEVA